MNAINLMANIIQIGFTAKNRGWNIQIATITYAAWAQMLVELVKMIY